MWEENGEAEAYAILTKSNKIDFQLNPESRGFIHIISYLHQLIDLCDPDIILDMDLKHSEFIGFGISEEFLLLTIKETFFPQIYEYCKKSKISYNIPERNKIILSFIFTRISNIKISYKPSLKPKNSSKLINRLYFI